MTGRPEAAAAIWKLADEKDADAAPAAARGRIRGGIQALVGVGIGFAVYQFLSPTIGRVMMGLAAVIGFCAVVSPTVLYAGLEKFFEASGRLLGRGLTWVLMVPLFYLFFLPFGKLLRRGQQDRLRRFYESDASTYWEERAGPTVASASRERQY